MEAQTVITLEDRATKNFTIATVTLLLAFFTLLLITHTNRTVQPAWLVLSLWLEFVICVTASFLCWARTIRLLKQAKQIGSYRDTNFASNNRWIRAWSLFNFSFFFSTMLPYNVFNQPNIQDDWLLSILYFKVGIVGLSLIVFALGFIDLPIIKTPSHKISSPLLDKRPSATAYVVYLIQFASLVTPYITWSVFSYRHNARYWFLDTDTIYFSLLLGLAILGIQALISSELIHRLRAKAALQH